MKRIISLILSVCLTVTLLSACGNGKEKANVSVIKNNVKPQLVVALSPILVFNEETKVTAFNDIKNSLFKDYEKKTVTTLSENTDWIWAYKNAEDWKKRGVYGLDSWKNGASASYNKLKAYTFSNDSTISLAPYSSNTAELKAYQGAELDAAGILMSISDGEEEGLCYQIKNDGTLAIPSGSLAAVQEVGGIKTGFLAEDGTPRSAAVKFILNSKVIWSGNFENSVAGGGEAVTALNYPLIADLPVKSGDMLIISIQLDAKVNSEEDITLPEDKNTLNNPVSSSGGSSSNTDAISSEVERITLMDKYDSRFSIVQSASASLEQKEIAENFRAQMVDVFDADVLVATDNEKEKTYEILFGLIDREESRKSYNELISKRENYAADYIIRVYGTKIVIVAGSDFALRLAAEYFMKNYCKTDRDSIPSNLNVYHRPKSEKLTIANTDISRYVIRTEKYPSLLTVRAAEALRQQIAERTGYAVNIVSSDTENANEILIGMTTGSGILPSVFKSGSLDGVGGYGYNDYRIFVKNGKLFVEAGSDYAANYAVIKLMDILEKTPELAEGFAVSGSYNQGEYSLLNGYGLTWGDEFAGDISAGATGLDKKKWKLSTASEKGPWYKKTDPYYLASVASLKDDDPNNDFGGPWLATNSSEYVQEGTNELVNRWGDNYWLENNMLVMTTKKTDNGYISTKVVGDGLVEFRYGILEARIIAATANGSASSFWARSRDGGKYVNEFDFFENFGIDQLKPNLHTWTNGGSGHINHGSQIMIRNIIKPNEGETFSDTFHHIALEWTSDSIKFYLDGKLYLMQDTTAQTWDAFRENTYLIFGACAPSGTYNSDGTNPGNWLMQTVSKYCEKQCVDYVRLYQLDSRQYSLRAKK